MNFKTTITLLIILIVVFAASWYAGIFSPEGKTKTATAVLDANKLLLITPKIKDVQSVKLEIKGRGEYLFVKHDKKWNITKPINAPAVDWEVTNIISNIEEAKKLESFIPGKKEISDTGLDNPNIIITLKEKERTVKVLVGKNVIASESTYVKLDNDQYVHIIDRNLRKNIKKNLTDYRDKQLWSVKKENLSELIFKKRDGTQFKFTKNNDDKWIMISPVRANADNTKLAEAVKTLASQNVQKFIEDNPKTIAPYGLKNPKWKITLVETQKIEPKTKPTTQKTTVKPKIKRTERTFLLGESSGLEKNQIYAKLADKKWVVTLKEDELTKALPDKFTWREKKLININKSDLTKIQITDKSQKTTLVKTGTWKLKEGKNILPVDSDTVDKLLQTITELKAVSFIDETNKIKHPESRIKLFLKDKVEPIEISIGQKTPSGLYRYIKRSGLNYLAAVSDENLDILFTPQIQYRNKKMIDLNVDHVKSISIQRKNRTYKLTRTTADTPWRATAPVIAAGNEKKIRNLLLTLTTLQAEKFVGQNNLTKFHLAKPDISVELLSEALVPVIKAKAATKPKKTKLIKQKVTIAFAIRRGKVYAAVTSEKAPLIAEISETVYNDLNAEFIDTKIFGTISTDKINKIELYHHPKQTITFVKENNKWTFPSDPIFQPDKDKLEKIITELSDLHAEKFISFDPEPKKLGFRRPYLKVTLSAADEKYELTIGKQIRSNSRAAMADTSKWAFELSKNKITKIDKTLKDLKK